MSHLLPRAGAIPPRADARPAPGTEARAKAMLGAEVGVGRPGLPGAANGGVFLNDELY